MDIPLEQLEAHPGNPNRMSAATFRKLKAHIKRTGRYEAIVVRPLTATAKGMAVGPPGVAAGADGVGRAPRGLAPALQGVAPKGPAREPQAVADGPKGVAAPPHGIAAEPPGVAAESQGVVAWPQGVAAGQRGFEISNLKSQIAEPRYQILNGHHRVGALRELGHKAARCDVWDVDETEALVLVATLNRLAGEDVPERRDALLAELLGTFEPPRLAELVPESASDLEELLRTLTPTGVPEPAPPESFEAVEFLTFAVSPEDRETIEAALRRTNVKDRARALVTIAKAYLTTDLEG